jgi:hypothetical protein
VPSSFENPTFKLLIPLAARVKASAILRRCGRERRGIPIEHSVGTSPDQRVSALPSLTVWLVPVLLIQIGGSRGARQSPAM